jgi:tripartite-type tricarboxylate transporter receptor subunit TctC
MSIDRRDYASDSKVRKRRATQTLALCCAALVVLVQGQAFSQQRYPSKPIRMIVPYPSGGSTDIVSRVLAQKLGENLKQSVIVDNRPGASGNIAAEVAAKAAPDGYTLLVGVPSTQTINMSLYSKLSYDPVRDFAPITLIATTPLMLVVNLSLPVKSVRELIALAKSDPGALTFASAGSGGTTHLAGELFKSMTGIKMTHVPYKGSPPALTDLLGQRVSLTFDAIPLYLPYVKAGKLKALAVTSAKRSRLVADLPTIAEAGIPGYEMTMWASVVVPAGTPLSIVGTLNTEIGKVLRSRDVHDYLSNVGWDPVANSPEEFSVFMSNERVKWAKVIKESGAHVD